jgi:hypothetical protein
MILPIIVNAGYQNCTLGSNAAFAIHNNGSEIGYLLVNCRFGVNDQIELLFSHEMLSRAVVGTWSIP